MKTLPSLLIAACALPVLSAVAQLAPPPNVTVATDLTASLSISPANPTASWPKSGDYSSLAPNYTATINVAVAAGGTVNGKTYALVNGSLQATLSASDTNVIWTGSSGGSSFSVTNTAHDAATAGVTVECLWREVRGGGGKKGPGAPLGEIRGLADASVSLLDSLIVWDYDPPSREKVQKYNPTQDPEIKWSATFYDTNNFGIERWTLTSLTTTDVLPLGSAWTIIPRGQTVRYFLDGFASSSVSTLGKINLAYNDGTPEERKSDELLMIPVTLVTPGGDPVASPVDGGDGSGAVPDGANEFTYSTAATGLLTLKPKATAPQIGALPASVYARFTFEVEPVGASAMAWDAASPGGKPSVTGDEMKAIATFTGLPANNSDFGKKKAKIAFDGQMVCENPYEVFFARDAKNHPGAGAGTTPNWFFYWEQVGGFGNLAYGGSHATRWGYYDYNGSDGHLDKAIIYDKVVLTDNPTGPMGKAGMDCFGQTAHHELKHYMQFHSSGYPDANGDGVPEWTASQDTDSDWLSDSYEDSHGFDKAKKDTDGDGILDLEEEPIAAESNWPNDSQKSKDWANPGKNKL